MEQKQAIADRLKQSNNILVTVSNNPSVDQLASCIGLTLALNKMGKHATAVFSGNVPSTIEFLQPEKTLEKNTDSLRDFIIALDKAKADKLRYKVEDKVVKIFITPYKTSINERDLDFSQGDFNVDVVVALGVHQQTDLDQAITAHGRILHDAVVATVNTKPGGELGTINWLDTTASSLSELVVQLIDVIDKQVMDGQMATALLTGIVAETNRFSNEKTTPQTMSISAELMGFGANQQLVATKLEEPTLPPPAPTPVHEQGASLQGEQAKPEGHTDDGTLEIAHAAAEPEKSEEPAAAPPPPLPAPEPAEEKMPEPEESPMPQIHIDEHGSLQNMEQIGRHRESLLPGSSDPTDHMASSHMILQPPAMGDPLTGTDASEEGPSGDPLSLPQPEGSGFGPSSFGAPTASATIAPPEMPYLPPSMTPGGTISPTPHDAPLPPPAAPPVTQPFIPTTSPPPAPFMTPQPSIVMPTPAAPAAPPLPPAPAPAPIAPPAPPEPTDETLSQIEADVNSPHLQGATTGEQPVPSPLNVAPTIQPPAPQPFVPLPAAPMPTPEAPVSPDLASARDAVLQAIAGQPEQAVGPEPIVALNAQPLGAPLHEGPAPAPAPAPMPPAPQPPINMDATANPTFTLPDVAPPNGSTPPATPPPMMPPSGPMN